MQEDLLKGQARECWDQNLEEHGLLLVISSYLYYQLGGYSVYEKTALWTAESINITVWMNSDAS